MGDPCKLIETIDLLNHKTNQSRLATTMQHKRDTGFDWVNVPVDRSNSIRCGKWPLCLG